MVLVSAVLQCESAMCIHISPLPWASLCPYPTLLGHQRALSWAPCAIQSFPLAIYFTHGSTCTSTLLLLLLSHFSCVRLCVTPLTAAHQAPPSLGFSRQEHWSGLPWPSPMHESEKGKGSRSVMFNSSQPHGLQPTGLLRPWDFPGKRTGVAWQ